MVSLTIPISNRRIRVESVVGSVVERRPIILLRRSSVDGGSDKELTQMMYCNEFDVRRG